MHTLGQSSAAQHAQQAARLHKDVHVEQLLLGQEELAELCGAQQLELRGKAAQIVLDRVHKFTVGHRVLGGTAYTITFARTS